jgi:hypothetical protein
MRTDILWSLYKCEHIQQFEHNKGDIFETKAHIAILTKGLFNYSAISNTHISNEILNPITTCKELFNVKLHQGNNPSDLTPTIDGRYTAFTIKYLNGYDTGGYDLNRLDTIMKGNGDIGLIVKDKIVIEGHRFNHPNYPDKKLLDVVTKNNMLFDSEDINRSLETFIQTVAKLKVEFSNVDELMEWMDEYYLECSRSPLTLKLHQHLAIRNFKRGMMKRDTKFMLSHKPRSGKTITLLYKAKLLLTDYNKDIVLLITSVPPTIDSFIDELKKYNEFKGLKYKTQHEFLTIENDFKGIILCSAQYLKNDCNYVKRNKLINLNIDAIIPDESHFGISTEKTSSDILNLYKHKHLICIFSSGTSRKTEKFYNIKKINISRWDIEDELYMNNLTPDNKIIMNIRHGSYFERSLKKIELNKDYSKCPQMILLQPTISINMIKTIDNYNKENNTDYGYQCSSFLALEQVKRLRKKDVKYNDKFQLDTNNATRKYLIAFLKMIINDDPMTECIMKQIQGIQNRYVSRHSNENNPLLFLMYLPYGQNIGSIDLIQKTLIKFLKDHKLWSSYHVCCSSSKYNSGDNNTSYQQFVRDELEKTKKLGKEGCILLLGDQGTLGITYPKCDVTISLDNGTNIDAQKQRNYRAGTESVDKTIGINVDLNIQRVLKYSKDVINKYRSVSNDKRSIHALQQHLFKEGLLIINPHEYQYGDNHETMIEYFEKLSSNHRMNIDIDTILDDLDCDDYLDTLITINDSDSYTFNESFHGKQQACNKGKKTKLKVDNLLNDNIVDNSDTIDISDEGITEDEYVYDINKTLMVNKTITKFAVLVLRVDRKNPIYGNMSNIELLKLMLDKSDEFKHIGNKLCVLYGIKQIDLNNIYLRYIDIMSTSDKHTEIINDMFDKLSHATPGELRILIDELYKATKSEEYDNAEIPTSTKCVDYGLNWIPDYWFTEPKKIGEITCGKGNFVLGIFEKFYKGLKNYEPDPLKRCKLIIQECIYFADIEWSNVFITRSLLISLAVDMMPNNTDWDILIHLYEIKCNEYVGNTLELNIKDIWKVDKFDAFVGNPPYQERNKDGKSKHGKSNLWTKFIEYSFKNLKPNGLLLYITPSSWMGGTVGCYKNMITKQIVNLNVNECKKYFPKIGSTFSYYLIENRDIYKPTKVICKYPDKNGSIYTSDIMLSKEIKIIPQLLTKEMISIMNKVCNWSQDKLFIRKDLLEDNKDWRDVNLSSKQNDTCQYPFLAYIQKDGTKDIQYCKTQFETQAYKKVMLFRHGYLNPTYDDGVNGVGNNIHYAKVDSYEEGQRLLNLYTSDLYKFIFSICKTSQFTNGRVMNWLYRHNPTYENIYSYFHITSDEIEFIEKNI